MRNLEQILPKKSLLMTRGLRYLFDSVLACSGSLLITGFIFTFHLYPRISNISNLCLLVVLVLAITRGRYAAILSAVVAFLSLAYFIVSPFYSLAIYRINEWIALFIFLLVAMLIAQLATALREQAEQARHRERETRQLSEAVRASFREAEQARQQLLAYEQAARAEAEAARARLHELFMQAPVAMAILRGPELRYEFANSLSLSYRDRADPVGKTVQEVLPELEEQGMLAILDKVYTTGTPFIGTELPVRLDRRGNGVREEANYNVVFQPSRTLQGDIDGIWVYSIEVTQLELHHFALSLRRENLVTIERETIAGHQAVHMRAIELAIPKAKVVPVIVDAGRIGQVPTNYLTNATKFAQTDQVIAVRLEVEASSVRVAVRDRGPGLTPEQQQRVWEQFYQVARPDQRGPERGMGLGLAIAKAIVEQHLGQVGVESVPGQGSTFWFTLPMEVSPEGRPFERN